MTTAGSGLRYLKSLVYSWTQDPDKIVKKFSIQGPRIRIKIVNKLSIQEPRIRIEVVKKLSKQGPIRIEIVKKLNIEEARIIKTG